MEEESEDPIPTDEHLLELQRPTVRPPLKSTRDRSPTPERFDSVVREGPCVKAVAYYLFNNEIGYKKYFQRRQFFVLTISLKLTLQNVSKIITQY